MKVMSGEILRLIIEAPPRHGKSELVCKKFPGLFLQTFPRRKVGLASYGADLAIKSCKPARDQTAEFGPRTFGYGVDPQNCSVDDWAIVDRHGRPTGGGMRAVGVGGSILGDGFDLWIIDDPIKPDDAQSPIILENCWDWWKGTAMDRLNPGGKSAIIVMMQRLNERDLVGRLLAEESGTWSVLTLRAEAEEDDILGRPKGEYLWPLSKGCGGWPDSFYEDAKADAFWWATKYQQRPYPRGGGMIQTAWIEDNVVWYRPTTDVPRIRYWDRAATEGGGDYTVGALLSRKGDNVYIEDIVRGQWGSGNRDRIIRQTCEDDNRRYPNGVVTWAEQEPGSAGKDNTVAFVKMLRPYAAHCETSSGSKQVRADGLASAFSLGEVHVCKGLEDNKQADKKHRWYDALVAELSAFPAGKHDDIVDAISGAFNKLTLDIDEDDGETVTMDERELVALEAEGY
jgi:predicted phage terminase large subunit-like protein